MRLGFPAIGERTRTNGSSVGHDSLAGGRALSSVALECRGLTKRFGDVQAVSEFDLTVEPGQIVALLGPSGCGKTTALRLIAGFEQPDAGTITIGDRTVNGPGYSAPPEHRNLGMVFQEGALFPHLNVAQNIAYGLPKGDGRADRVNEVLGLVGMTGMARRMPHELSGGQQQRVALARALAPRPDILLMDEPFSNLDQGLREQIRRDVLEILKKGEITAVFVTHDHEEALYMGDRIAVMNQGQIEQFESPTGIFHGPATRFVAEFFGMVDFIPAWWDGDSLTTEVVSVNWPDAIEAIGHQPEGADSQNSPLEVMVRADCLDCYPSDEGRAIVVEREFRGSFFLYRVLLPSGRSVRCLLSHIMEIPVGATVSVGLRDGHTLKPFIKGKAVVLA